MTLPGVLIVDDEIKLCRNIALKLKRQGYTTYEAYDGKAALRKVQHFPIHLVVLDYMLTDTTGLEVLKKIKEISPQTRVYMLTAYGNVENAVLAMKWGASDYLNKPIDLKRIAELVEEAFQSLNDLSGGVVFQSPKMQAIHDVLGRISGTDAPVLLYGESGTGKTTWARWVHDNSRRKDMPFLAVNCGSMPENLLERELFGASGRAVAADGGTLFLDEIGGTTPLIQAHLLRLLEENRILTPDTQEMKPVNVRLITSTSRSLQALVNEGRFLEDLYYKLNLVEVGIPPLRERKEDIPLLVKAIMAQLNTKYGKPLTFSEKLLEVFMDMPWQGNISEMMNLIERMHLLKVSGELDTFDLPSNAPETASGPRGSLKLQGRLYDVLEEIEERMILDALEKTRGNQSKAAEMLGISRNAFIYKMKRIGR